MTKDFKIQIPTQIVRSKKITTGEFILCAKLIQAYYSQAGDEKPLTFTIDHKYIMHYLDFKDNKTFKMHLKGLCAKGLIESKLYDKEKKSVELPRKGGLEITLNKIVVPEFNKERGYFTQLPYIVLNREVIEAVGHVGVRLLYYFKSYINAKEHTKQYCFASEETIADDLGIAKKTVIKYNKLLAKWKFIKIDKHELENTYTYTPTQNGKEKYLYTRYNNHYFIRMDKIEKYCEESRPLLAQNV